MNKREINQLPSWPIQKNIDLLVQREVYGLTKYPRTLGESGHSHAVLLQHGLEEALDLANYLQTALGAERENALYKAEHAHLLKLIYGFKDELSEKWRFEDKAEVEVRFLDLLHDYEIAATRRGIRL